MKNVRRTALRMNGDKRFGREWGQHSYPMIHIPSKADRTRKTPPPAAPPLKKWRRFKGNQFKLKN